VRGQIDLSIAINAAGAGSTFLWASRWGTGGLGSDKPAWLREPQEPTTLTSHPATTPARTPVGSFGNRAVPWQLPWFWDKALSGCRIRSREDNPGWAVASRGSAFQLNASKTNDPAGAAALVRGTTYSSTKQAGLLTYGW